MRNGGWGRGEERVGPLSSEKFLLPHSFLPVLLPIDHMLGGEDVVELLAAEKIAGEDEIED